MFQNKLTTNSEKTRSKSATKETKKKRTDAFPLSLFFILEKG